MQLKASTFFRQAAAVMLAGLLLAAPAWCQSGGVPDTSGLRQIGGWFLAVVFFFAAIGCAILIGTGIFHIRGDDYGGGLKKVGIGVIGGFLIAAATPWVISLTGIAIEKGSF